MTQIELLKREINPPVLRDYQLAFIRAIYAEIRKGEKRILGVSGTGSGKTGGGEVWFLRVGIE